MKKVVTLVVMTFVLIFTLTGCIHSGIDVSIRDYGTGSLGVTMGFEEDFYNDLIENGNAPFEGKETFTYSFNDKTYVGCREVKEYNSFDELRDALMDMKYATEYIQTSEENTEPENLPIFKDVKIEKKPGLFKTNYSFCAELNEQKTEEEVSMYDFNEVFKVSVSVEMPGEITEHRGGELSENKVVYDLQDLTESNELYVSSQAVNTAAVVAVIAVVIVIMAAGVIAAIKMK